jgi:ADP-ribose pyrophosphatase YjhB (NUDIX family)
MARHTRYQGVIIKDQHVLLIRHSEHSTGNSYWVIPGGGLDGKETEEECVIREMLEETHLEVRVEKLIFDEPAHPDGVYKWRKTYLCIPISGEAKPGYEPELDASSWYSISEVRWFDLSDESEWGDNLIQDPYTYPQLVNLRRELGYLKE